MTDITLAAFLKLQDDLDNRLSGIQKAVTGNPRRTIGVSGSIVGQNNKTVCAVLQGPPGGYEWHVRRISLEPTLAAATTSVTQQGTLILGKGQVGVGPDGLYTPNQTTDTFIGIARTTVVPDAITFSTSECVIRAGENIILAWVSGVGTLIINGDCEQLTVGAQTGLEA